MKIRKHKSTPSPLAALVAFVFHPALAVFILHPASPALADGLQIDSASLSPLPATEGVAYEATLSATGGSEPYSWSLLPSGYAEISPATSSFAEVGEARGWHADDGCWELDLPFEFPFYGQKYTSVRVSSNGFIDFGNSWNSWWDEDSSRPCVTVVGHDLRTDVGDSDIFVEADASRVTIRWKATYYSAGTAVNASVALFPNGKIVLSYGGGNEQEGFIGISAGDGEKMLVSSMSHSGSMDNAADIVFDVVGMPEGLALSEDGTLSGTVDEPGEYRFGVSVTDANGESAEGSVNLLVEENPASRPSFTSFSPANEYVNLTDKASQYFLVGASHPSGGTVRYAWTLDGEPVGTSSRIYAYRRADDALHAIRLEISADDLPKTSVREWKTGVLSITNPESLSVSYGKAASLSVEVNSSIAATVKWYDADTDEQVGEGLTLEFTSLEASGSYYAMAESPFGTVKSAVATLTAAPTPDVGRVYKMTGPAFIGNRLVLRAKPYGDLSEATYSWTRDGVEVSTNERLDIAALATTDFGEYTLTVTSPHGTASSEPFVLTPAPAGVPLGWGADGHGRTETPEGLSGVAQIASGMNFNLALTTNGTVTAWGYNGHGGCNVPASLANVSFVAAGGYESMGAGFAVKTDGTVLGWGTPHAIEGWWDTEYCDDFDEFGNWIGSHTEQYWYEYTNGWDTVSTIPAGLSDVVQLAVGGEFAVALKADGSVVTWGSEGGWWDDVYDNETGDYLGQEWVPEQYYVVPRYVTDVVSVAAGFEYIITLHADGTVKVWGKEFHDYGQYDVPQGLTDIVAVAATKRQWDGAASFALGSDGTVYKWGDRYNYTGYQSGETTGQVAIDAGQEHLITLDANGFVSVFTNWDGYRMRNLPSAVEVGGVLGIAAAGYHCTAILRDSDGDTIPDTEEALLGRDPNAWEDYHKAQVVGFATVGGELLPNGAVLTLYDATGGRRGRVATEDDGLYIFDGIIPGRYFLKIEANGAKDIWVVGAMPGDGVEAPFDTFESGSITYDFDLEPGQAEAWAQVVPRQYGTDETDPDGGLLPKVELTSGMTIYLDMWPTSCVDGDKVLLGEVAASHSSIDGTTLLPHTVTLKLSDSGNQIPAPDCSVGGEELATVIATPMFSAQSGSAMVSTEPAGAEVWIDYADKPLGTTPLVVENLSAAASHAHVLLLRKEGFLRPRPVEFRVAENETTDIAVALAPSTAPAMSMAVSSAVSGTPIYLDYLPTGLVTPATVGGMDPASHSGDLWHSASHSILLRHSALSPFAPRVVPEWDVDSETNLPVAPAATPAIDIFAPNTYEWDGWGVVTLTAADAPDFSAPGAFSVGTASSTEGGDLDLPEGSTVITLVVSNPVPGAWYTPFVAESVDAEFTAYSSSVQAVDGDEELVFHVVGGPQEAAKFVRLSASIHEFRAGEALPEQTAQE